MKLNVTKRGFTFFRKSLNPEKHIYFNRHYTDHSESLYWPGRILQPKSFAAKGSNADYIEQTKNALFNYLREKYPDNFQYTVKDYDAIKNNSFYCYNVDIFDHFVNVSNILADSVIVKESRFRPAVEQKIRKDFNASKFIFQNINLGSVTIREFIEIYAKGIEQLAIVSNNGRKNKYNLDASLLEDMYELDQNNTLNLEKGHDNVLNRMLNYIL